MACKECFMFQGQITDYEEEIAFLKSALKEAAELALNPYGDEVQAMAGMEPKEVGERISEAIRKLTA